MAAAMTTDQMINLERAFSAKNYKFGESTLVVRAQQLAQQLHISPESFANQYESFALISDWNMEVTGQRLKMVAQYLEAEQRKENSRPRTGDLGASTGASALKAVPQAGKPTWEDLSDRIDFPTPSAKRQALDSNAVNPGSAWKPGTVTKLGAASGSAQNAARLGFTSLPRTPQTSGKPQGQQPGVASTPLATMGPNSAQPPSAFAMRTNQGQVVAVLHNHLPGPAAYCQQQQVGNSGTSGVVVRPLGQPALDSEGLLFMMEMLENKVHALDERIMDFADALTATTRLIASAASDGAATADDNRTRSRPSAGALSHLNPPTPASALVGTQTLMLGTVFSSGGDQAAAAQQGDAALSVDAVVDALQHSVADLSHQPEWIAGRVLAETEGAPLNAESLLLEGCREASCGIRVRLDVSCVPAYRVFPGQSVCAYGLNPTGAKFMAQRLVTHVPPPSALGAAVGLGSDVAAAVTTSREGGLSLVLAAGPYCLADDLSYSPLEDLLTYCTAHPPDVLLLLGPFVDSEHPGVVSGGGTGHRTVDCLMREEVLQRLAGWRSEHPAAVVAMMPAVRDMTALPVLPQPAMTAAVQALGPPDKAVALQNPSTVALGPLVLGACSSDVLKSLSASEHSRVPLGTAVERLPALASHVLGQRSFYPIYPAAVDTCLDTTHYSQLQLPVTPDVLLMPSDLAPFAKVLQPSAWMAGGPPGLVEAAAAGCSAGAISRVETVSSAAEVVIVNPGRLARGSAGGTFAHVVVTAGTAPLLERMRVEIKRV